MTYVVYHRSHHHPRAKTADSRVVLGRIGAVGVNLALWLALASVAQTLGRALF